jgi:hypothetical protein
VWDTISHMANAEGSGVRVFFYRAWRVVRWPLLVLVVLYIGLVVYRAAYISEQNKSDAAVAFIQTQKITMNDVDGKHLPPVPDPAQANATVAGIDANGNGIRDDVELAIFKLHPDSARIRAAELQYAMALQDELVNANSIDTLSAAIWNESRGYFCIDSTLPWLPKESTDLEFSQQDEVFTSRIDEVKNLALNTAQRKQKRDDVFKKYMSSHSSPANNYCDIDLTKLSN